MPWESKSPVYGAMVIDRPGQAAGTSQDCLNVLVCIVYYHVSTTIVAEKTPTTTNTLRSTIVPCLRLIDAQVSHTGQCKHWCTAE